MIFVSYVFGDYYKFIAPYKEGVKRAYPDCDVKVFTEKEMPRLLKTPHGGRSMRWLIPYEKLKGYKYAYIGDVDMIIKKETPSLTEMHVRHMEKTGLPFSNGIRPEGKRMSGLHFIDVERYYAKMNPVIKKIGRKELKKRLKGKTDEHFLYHIVREGIGFNGLEERITEGGDLYYRPHHGLHMKLIKQGKEYLIESVPDHVDMNKIKSFYD